MDGRRNVIARNAGRRVVEMVHVDQKLSSILTREAFLERLESDLIVVRQYPPQLRWLVQNEDDEAMLVQAARTVFDAPRDPPSHESAFLAMCVAGVGSAPGR